MSRRLPVSPAPEPLEAYVRAFDSLFARRNQRDAFRRYLEGLLLPTERNKTLTALANTEPVVGAQHRRAQGLQWFLSESTWKPEAINGERLRLLRSEPVTAPHRPGAWQAVTRRFGDGHDETWWALEGVAGPYGREKSQRAVIVTTDPLELPALTTWCQLSLTMYRAIRNRCTGISTVLDSESWVQFQPEIA